MGAIQHIYILPRLDASLASVEEVARALLRGGLVKPPFLSGAALHREPAGAWLAQTPQGATYQPERYPSHHSLDEALARLGGAGGGMVEVEVAASHFRRQPEHFYDGSASLGFYRVPQGYDLVIGVAEDLSEFIEDWTPQPPIFEGRVSEWVWLEGKNAPLQEDFVGSALHEAVLAVWPEARVFEDCWA